MIEATIWLPIAPPIVRTFAFMPVATPVCAARHGLDDEVRHRREREADAEADERHRHVEVPLAAVRDGQEQHADAR